MPLTEMIPFGLLLKQLRKRMGMTQRDLAAALNYSDTLICNLEKAKRLPDLDAVITRFVPALGLQDDPAAAAHLIESAAAARGERPPAVPQSLVNLQGFKRGRFREEVDEQPAQLSSSPTELIGRTAEVDQLCNRLPGHSGRLLTLVGPPGIGKTRLSLAVAERLQHHYPDGVVFVALAEITDPVLMASAILTAVGSKDASPKPPKIKLVEFLRRKSMLLVIDNCEQIRDATPLVAELLAACAGIAIVATSRERLHLRAEQRYRVPPLELAAAVGLFTQRALAVEAGFELTTANRPTIEAICLRLDCLPLALELCAAQIDLLSPAQLLAHLHEHRLDLLVDGAHDLPPQHRTLRHAIQRSYALLSEAERTLFRCLGLFSGGFELETIEAVDPLRTQIQTVIPTEIPVQVEPLRLHSTLHALIGKYLVRAETLPSGESRFLLLETIREFALEQLRAHGEEAELRQRHFAAYLHLFRTGDSHLRGSQATTWMARLEPEKDNLRAALQWALDEGRYADTAWLLLAAGYFWYLNGNSYEGAKWLAQLLPHRQALAVDLRLACSIDFVGSARGFKEFPEIESYSAEIIKLIEICPYKQLQADAWYFLASQAPDPTQKAAALAKSIALTKEGSEAPELGPQFCTHADHDFSVSANQWGYACFLIDHGEVAQAARLIADSLQRFRKRGNIAWIGDCLGTLGLLALFRGDIVEAQSCLQEVVTIGTTYNLPTSLAEWQSRLGLVTLYGGNVIEAKRHLEEGLRLCLEVRNVRYLMRACICLAEMALWEEDADQAAHWLEQSLTYQTPPRHFTIDELPRLFIAARLATMQGQYQRAAILLGAAEAGHRQIHYMYAGPMLPLVNAAHSKVREALGAELFDEAFAAGTQLSLHEEFTTILPPAQITSILQPPSAHPLSGSASFVGATT